MVPSTHRLDLFIAGMVRRAILRILVAVAVVFVDIELVAPALCSPIVRSVLALTGCSLFKIRAAVHVATLHTGTSTSMRDDAW